jgi:hypothetical protein
MNDPEYPELRTVELDVVCPPLERLPVLPIRVRVTASSAEIDGRKPLASRLQRVAEELGVESGVRVDSTELVGGPPDNGCDVLWLRLHSLPPAPGELELPDPDRVAVVSDHVSAAGCRFWILDMAEVEDPHAVDRRAEALARRVVGLGCPPAVLVPAAWDTEQRLHFHEELLRRALHDAPLERAASKAAGTLRPLPALVIPGGRRHGLDLGRLLEHHRVRIEEGFGRLRMLEKELDASRPFAAAAPPGQWASLEQAVDSRLPELKRLKENADEINRDRDPAGWARLLNNIEDLRRLQEGVRRDRTLLEGLRSPAGATGAAG